MEKEAIREGWGRVEKGGKGLLRMEKDGKGWRRVEKCGEERREPTMTLIEYTKRSNIFNLMSLIWRLRKTQKRKDI